MKMNDPKDKDPFEQWFNGQEGWGLRSERLAEDMPTMSVPQWLTLIGWLKAAYGEGLREGCRSENYGLFSSPDLTNSTIEKPKK